MNSEPDSQHLLTDVLSEATPVEFREAMLSETLRLALRKRRLRHARQVSGVLVLLAVAAIAIVRNMHRSLVKPGPISANYQLVHTQPLSEEQIVVTRSLAARQFVASMESGGIVHTIPAAAIREISDDELLALAPQPAALIRLGPHEMELVIVKPDGKSGVPVN